MKNFLFFVCIVIIFSCAAPKDRYDLIHEKQAEELKKGNYLDSTFLGFKFGMNKEEVENHFSKLLHNNRIQLNENNEYEMTIPLDYISGKANFSTNFIHDSLYSVTLKIKAESFSQLELIQLKMVQLLLTKYGTPLKVKSLLNENEEEYIFINGKQQITVNYPFMDIVMVDYCDFTMEDRKLKIDQEKREAETKSAINNF